MRRHLRDSVPNEDRQPSVPRTERLRLIRTPATIDPSEFAHAVETGLTAKPKYLPCRYLYDEEGSQLFEEICELPEYYLTRAERSILREHAQEIAARFDGPVTLAELGSGSASKTRIIIDALLARHGALRYVPVDISPSMLEESSRALLDEYRSLEILAIAGEYREGLRRLARETHRPKLILWLGSNVGNLYREEAAEFLESLRRLMAPHDRLLVGIDLRKDRDVLERAYDDARGVTAKFILNLLARINRELGGQFDLSAFHHRAVYNQEEGRVEICLVSKKAQAVAIEGLDLVVPFKKGETIDTEYSFKYSPVEIDNLAFDAGLRIERQWLDHMRRFSVNLLAPDTQES
jgi:L-histidine N-alpha-methyltransferase